MTDLCHRIRQLRLKNGISTETLANLLYVSRQAYHNYEKGTRQMSHESLLALANFYHVSMDYLYGRTDSDLLPSSMDTHDLLFLKKLRALDPKRQTILLQILDEMGREYLPHSVSAAKTP